MSGGERFEAAQRDAQRTLDEVVHQRATVWEASEALSAVIDAAQPPADAAVADRRFRSVLRPSHVGADLGGAGRAIADALDELRPVRRRDVALFAHHAALLLPIDRAVAVLDTVDQKAVRPLPESWQRDLLRLHRLDREIARGLSPADGFEPGDKVDGASDGRSQASYQAFALAVERICRRLPADRWASRLRRDMVVMAVAQLTDDRLNRAHNPTDLVADEFVQPISTAIGPAYDQPLVEHWASILHTIESRRTMQRLEALKSKAPGFRLT